MVSLVHPIAYHCKEWFKAGVNKSDVHPINLDGRTPFQVYLYYLCKFIIYYVYCDMETDGGGWGCLSEVTRWIC